MLGIVHGAATGMVLTRQNVRHAGTDRIGAAG